MLQARAKSDLRMSVIVLFLSVPGKSRPKLQPIRPPPGWRPRDGTKPRLAVRFRRLAAPASKKSSSLSHAARRSAAGALELVGAISPIRPAVGMSAFARAGRLVSTLSGHCGSRQCRWALFLNAVLGWELATPRVGESRSLMSGPSVTPAKDFHEKVIVGSEAPKCCSSGLNMRSGHSAKRPGRIV